MVEIKKEGDTMNCFGVDAFRFAKELGKHRFLGERKVLGYTGLFNRIKDNLELIRKIQAKKEKSQLAYENKESTVSEI